MMMMLIKSINPWREEKTHIKRLREMPHMHVYVFMRGEVLRFTWKINKENGFQRGTAPTTLQD